jgi:hypothetical protein
MDGKARVLGATVALANAAVLLWLVAEGAWWWAAALALWTLGCCLVEIGARREFTH